MGGKAFVAASAFALLACGCLALFPRRGPENYVLQETGPDAVRCGAFTREPGEPHELSAEEEAAVSRCMTEAHADGKRFYFYLEGPGIDSQLAWGLLMRPQGLASFRYDSAPCGGDACAESFVITDCPTPARRQTIRPEDDGCPAG